LQDVSLLLVQSRGQSALQHLLEQQHQSQRLKETEQTDKEGWFCAALEPLSLIDKRRMLQSCTMDKLHILYKTSDQKISVFSQRLLQVHQSLVKEVISGHNNN